MALDRDQDVVIDADVDEDDMPPLVDDPNPTYTFFSGTTPLSFTSTSAPTATQDDSPQPSRSLLSSLPASPINPDEPTSSSTTPMSRPRPHAKRRDPSYIPRPPNAFILFRCAFIRDQNVTGKVEGNHSRLSKIIGLCWKQLTPEQREVWEAKAVLAQAEHRANYPDWRFRPGANALAKLKSKDGNSTGTSRRRSVRRPSKDQPTTEEAEEGESPASDPKGKGKGKAKPSRIPSIEEIRCAKIAGFVAEGIRGQELEVAVKEWEGDHKIPKTNARSVKSKGRTSQASSSSSSHIKSHSITPSQSQSQPFAKHTPDESHEVPSLSPHNSRTSSVDLKSPISENSADTKTSSAEPVTNLGMQDVPLTHMFKRSLSAPVAKVCLPSAPSLDKTRSLVEENSSSSAEPNQVWGTFKPLTVEQETPTRSQNRRDTISFPMPSTSSAVPFDPPQHLTWQEAENQRRMEEMQSPDSWWSSRPTASSSHFAYDEHKTAHRDQHAPAKFTTDSMGYESSQQGSQFDRAYLEQYGAYDHVPDGSQRVQWTNMSANNRSGMVTIVEDPYKDDCNNNNNNNSPSTDSPPTLSLPPPSSGNYYRSPISPITPPGFASSSFSTLTGWAGDYKDNTSDIRTWPSEQTSASTSSSAWYNSEGALPWGVEREELRHSHLAIDSEDWDHLEYRAAASDPRYQVQPPRSLDFMSELRRMHGGAA